MSPKDQNGNSSTHFYSPTKGVRRGRHFMIISDQVLLKADRDSYPFNLLVGVVEF